LKPLLEPFQDVRRTRMIVPKAGTSLHIERDRRSFAVAALRPLSAE
jgi:hypothetical protein